MRSSEIMGPKRFVDLSQEDVRYEVRKFIDAVEWSAGKSKNFSVPAVDFLELSRSEKDKFVLGLLNTNKEQAQVVDSEWARKFIHRLFLD